MDIIKKSNLELKNVKLSFWELLIIIFGFVPISLIYIGFILALVLNFNKVFNHTAMRRQSNEKRFINTHISNFKLGMNFESVIAKSPNLFKIDSIDTLLEWKNVKGHGLGYAVGKMDTLDIFELYFLSDTLVTIELVCETVKDTAAIQEYARTIAEKKPSYLDSSKYIFNASWYDDFTSLFVILLKLPKSSRKLLLSLTDLNVLSSIDLYEKENEILSEAERSYFLKFNKLIQRFLLNDSSIVEIYGDTNKSSLVPLKTDRYLKESIFYLKPSENISNIYKIDSLLLYYSDSQLWKYRISFCPETNWVILFVLKNAFSNADRTLHWNSNPNIWDLIISIFKSRNYSSEEKIVIKEDYSLTIDTIEIIYSLKFFEKDEKYKRIPYPDYLEYCDLTVKKRMKVLESLRPFSKGKNTLK